MNNKVKNIIGIIGLGVLMTSCSITHNTVGDITLLDNNGEIIREWDNSIIHQEMDNGYTTFTSLKNGGLNFVDESGEAHYISGGIIIVDNIKETKPIRTSINTSSPYNPYTIEKETVRKENSYDPYDQDHQP